MNKHYLLSVVIMLVGAVLPAQEVIDTILVKNQSFEQGAYALGLPGWTDCSFPGETPFDAHPMPKNPFSVQETAYEGIGFVGMVVRDNETWEAMSQQLLEPLQADQCYAFELMLARAKTYISQSRITRQESFYVTPARIRLWGANQPCGRRELLAETGVVTNHVWKAFTFKFTPKRDYRYFVIEAFFKTPTLFPYNGNVLVDAASNIYQMDCNDSPEEVLLAIKEETTPLPAPIINPPTPKPNNPPEKINPPTPKPKKEDPPKPTPVKKYIMPELDEKMMPGRKLRIKKLTFQADSFQILPSAYPVLDEIYAFLSENPNVKIELGGHTSSNCDTKFCNKLSMQRAKSVADYLFRKGISTNRIFYKGYGKNNPVAPNNNATNRRKNQRVEIKILRL